MIHKSKKKKEREIIVVMSPAKESQSSTYG